MKPEGWGKNVGDKEGKKEGRWVKKKV